MRFSTLVTVLLFNLAFSPFIFAQKNKNKNATPELKPWEIDTLVKPIPTQRILFAEYVDRQVKAADLKDGKLDNKITVKDTSIGRILTQTLIEQVPLIKIHIENTEADNQTKIMYHRALESTLKKINAKNFDDIDILYTRRIINNFEEIIIAREDKNVSEFVKKNANIYTLDNSDLLNDYPNDKAHVYTVVGIEKPELIINKISEIAKEPYADPIVASAAKVVPGTILKYALSTSSLSTLVRRNKDPLVKAIVDIADNAKEPWMVLPFLGEINDGKTTAKAVDAITKNPEEYYKALVDLKKQNQTLGAYNIDQELHYKGLKYIRLVNDLHNSPAPVRFKSLMNFRAEDLYFLMIGGQDEIYTSSFVWMFKRMMEKMTPQTGDEFLESVHKYHFRTFLRMSAGYNTLTPFLASMKEDKVNNLLKEFVHGLESGSFDDVEGAVDVADAYGSIHDEKVTEFIKNEVISNYKRVTELSNKDKRQKGIIIYGLLSTILATVNNPESMNNELSQFIPPIMYVPYSGLVDKDGKVIEISFFYGDGDGKTAYNSYISSFKNNNWKIVTNEYWATITSTTASNPIVIYANRPLPEEKGEDEIAQKELLSYLMENNINPTVVIHRGHSYYLPTTLSYLTPAAKIVMLGSCGGYHNLATVLNNSPEAHIISSKQVGALNVNEPIIKAIDKKLANGKDVNWIELWNELGEYFDARPASQRDLFKDYIPPNRNLGAIFIKAYRKMAASMEM